MPNLKKWNKFLVEQYQIDEISQKYIDDIQKFLKDTPPEKLSFNNIFQNKTRIVIPLEGVTQETPISRDLKNFQKVASAAGWNIDYKSGLMSRFREHIIPAGPQQGQKVKKENKIKIGKFLQRIYELEKQPLKEYFKRFLK